MTDQQHDPRDVEMAKSLIQDAPPCGSCGAVTVRSGDMAKCLNCGHDRNWYIALQYRIASALTQARREAVQPYRDCLELLHSVQNGCPLYKYEADWNKAMQDAERLLGYTSDTKETPLTPTPPASTRFGTSSRSAWGGYAIPSVITMRSATPDTDIGYKLSLMIRCGTETDNPVGCIHFPRPSTPPRRACRMGGGGGKLNTFRTLRADASEMLNT